MENPEIHLENCKLLFSLQNVLKVLNNAVILLCWNLETVVWARRSKQLKFSKLAFHEYCAFSSSLSRSLEYWTFYVWTVSIASWKLWTTRSSSSVNLFQWFLHQNEGVFLYFHKSNTVKPRAKKLSLVFRKVLKTLYWKRELDFRDQTENVGKKQEKTRICASPVITFSFLVIKTIIKCRYWLSERIEVVRARAHL